MTSLHQVKGAKHMAQCSHIQHKIESVLSQRTDRYKRQRVNDDGIKRFGSVVVTPTAIMARRGEIVVVKGREEMHFFLV